MIFHRALLQRHAVYKRAAAPHYTSVYGKCGAKHGIGRLQKFHRRIADWADISRWRRIESRAIFDIKAFCALFTQPFQGSYTFFHCNSGFLGAGFERESPPRRNPHHTLFAVHRYTAGVRIPPFAKNDAMSLAPVKIICDASQNHDVGPPLCMVFLWTEADFNRRIVLIGQIKSGLDVVELKFVGNQRFNLNHSLCHGTQGFRHQT